LIFCFGLAVTFSISFFALPHRTDSNPPMGIHQLVSSVGQKEAQLETPGNVGLIIYFSSVILNSYYCNQLGKTGMGVLWSDGIVPQFAHLVETVDIMWSVVGSVSLGCANFREGCVCERCQNARMGGHVISGLREGLQWKRITRNNGDGNGDNSYVVPEPLHHCQLHKVSKLAELRRFRKESIGGNLAWNARYTAHLTHQCGPEAVSWCMQLANIASEGLQLRSGPNTCVHMGPMLQSVPLQYEEKKGLNFEEVNRHLEAGMPVLVLLTSVYRDNFSSNGFDDVGKYHWIILTGRDSTDYSWYWAVSNGSIPCKIHSSVLGHLVNKAIGELFRGGCYAGNRVILVFGQYQHDEPATARTHNTRNSKRR
jgi:hypothetical protein